MLKSVANKYILMKKAYKGGVISLMFTYTQVNSLNETEAHVYNYIMQNKEKVLDESIRELASNTHVSTATIVRFCKKMGCVGFLEFKYKLKDSITTEEHEEQIEESSFVDFINHIKTQEYLESVKRTAEHIKQADSFYTLGLGGHEAYAKHMARSFSHIGYHCFGITDRYYPMPHVLEGQSSVIIMVYDKLIEKFLFDEIRKYKEKNYTIIMISSEDIAVMKHLCDEVIYVSNGYVKTDDICSGIPMIYTMEKIMRELLK